MTAAPTPAPRWVRGALLVGGVALAATLGSTWPVERRVRYLLGSQAPDVVELEARWTEGKTTDAGAELHVSSFRFARGHAPRIVEERLRLKAGTYSVELVVASADMRRVIRRTIELESPAFGSESALSIDVAGSLGAEHDVQLDSRTQR